MYQYFGDDFLHLLRKGVYPYESMDDNWKDKLKENKLPDIEYFHSTLNNEKWIQSDYDYAQHIFKKFKCKNLKAYNDLYVLTDVVLLANILEDYTIKNYNTYNQDPIYCISSPGYANKAMLFITKAEIRLITNTNILLIFLKGKRGGRCEPFYIETSVNNKYVNKKFDKDNQIETHLQTLDVNSLYPTAMTYKLPYGKFKCDKSISKCTTEYILNLNPNDKYFYVFVVDIICPEELHDTFEKFPLLTDHEISPGDNTIKLMATLNDKKEYVISLHMLKFVLEKGYELDKIHAIIYAKQKAFIKKFIELNNKKRTEASINNDQIGVQYYKNSSNSTFGKQIENPEKYRDFHIVTDENKAKSLASKCTFKEAHILDEDNNIVI